MDFKRKIIKKEQKTSLRDSKKEKSKTTLKSHVRLAVTLLQAKTRFVTASSELLKWFGEEIEPSMGNLSTK